jgi:hypothetical protein
MSKRMLAFDITRVNVRLSPINDNGTNIFSLGAQMYPRLMWYMQLQKRMGVRHKWVTEFSIADRDTRNFGVGIRTHKFSFGKKEDESMTCNDENNPFIENCVRVDINGDVLTTRYEIGIGCNVDGAITPKVGISFDKRTITPFVSLGIF